MAGTRGFKLYIEREASPQKMVVILRESGVSSTPRPLDIFFAVSGILDRPPSRTMPALEWASAASPPRSARGRGSAPRAAARVVAAGVDGRQSALRTHLRCKLLQRGDAVLGRRVRREQIV